jgi:transcriptional regulator with PAS, ATPase and Fis domain
MGRIQYADGGTLFLDEIGDMQPALQAKLLRVIQEKEFQPVGGLRATAVDVRIVAATHRDLEKLVAEGQFREDLYYRLSVIPVAIPPLRERKEDIPVLIDTFIQVFNRNRKFRLKGFGADAISALLAYRWPGNVRELENLVQRMVVLHGAGTIRMGDLPGKYIPHLQEPSADSRVSTELTGDDSDWNPAGIDLPKVLAELEDRLIRKALRMTQGNKREAAALLNLKRTTLLEKLKKKGLG